MFGYVIIDKPNILIKDYQTYRSYYCGLCKSIGKTNGNLMRFTLNYDIVMLALLAFNYEECEPVFKKGKCPVHCFRKIEYVDNNVLFERISDINVILGYYKVYDDVLDENKHKAIKCGITPYYKKSAKRMPKFDLSVKEGYDRLRKEEKDKNTISVLSDIFGSILMSAGDAVTDKCDSTLRELLFYVGKWIYIIDAYDDIKKDFENHSFNPFLRENKNLDDIFFDNAEAEARRLLYECLDKISSAYNKMKITVSEGALSNIIYLGLKNRTETIIKGRGNRCQKIRL